MVETGQTLWRLTRCRSQLNLPLPWESSWSTREWKRAPPTLPPLIVSVSWTLWTICEFVEGHFLVSLHFTRTRIVFSPFQTTQIDLFCLVILCVVLQSPLQPSAIPTTQSSLSPISPLASPQPLLSGAATPLDPLGAISSSM